MSQQGRQGYNPASILVGALLAGSILSALLAASAAELISQVDYSSNPSNPSSIVLAKILQDSKQITDLIRLLSHQRAVQEGSQEGEQEKRDNQAAWDMDYGWGGGRFGKRMDSLGIAGRFGRSVDKRKEHPKSLEKI